MISVFGSKVGIEELEEIKTSIDNQWLGIGNKTRLFEELFKQRLSLNDFVLLDSGSNSIYMALKILDLPKGSEVIMPALTWISCASAVVFAGLKPVFCDVEIDSQNVNADFIAEKITKNTSAIMIVHYGGLPVDIEPILSLGYPVIEDAAHAVDSKIGDQYCGSFGDVGIYSFDGVKNLAIGEAGGVTAKDISLINKAKKLRYCGIEKSGFEASANKNRWWEYKIFDCFIKMIPDDISASIGLAQLAKLDAHQKYRKYIWNIYQSQFNGVSWFETPVDSGEGIQHSYFTYLIRLNNNRRDELAKYLYDKGIYTTFRYQPLNLMPIYNCGVHLKNSEILNETGLNIPLHPSLSESDIDYIVTSIKDFKC